MELMGNGCKVQQPKWRPVEPGGHIESGFEPHFCMSSNLKLPYPHPLNSSKPSEGPFSGLNLQGALPLLQKTGPLSPWRTDLTRLDLQVTNTVHLGAETER